jgi:uncharacterized RDD family membrane protein YckC
MNAEVISASAFAGAWRRLGAFLIDGVLIGLVGISAGYFLFDAFVDIGVWGRLLGFLVSLVYFGTLNSRLGHGQTVGKRILKIKVTAADGSALSIQKAILRFAVIGTPWFLNGAWFPAGVLESPLIYLLSVLVFGAGLSIVYLFIFNRPTRQSLHDLAAGSYVVPAESTAPNATQSPGRVHLIVVSILLVASMALPYFTKGLVAKEPFAALMQAYEAVSAAPGVVHANVNKGWSKSASGETTYLQVTAYLSEPRIDDTDMARRLARLAIDAHPTVITLDLVQVILVYGYDIGIASAHRSRTFGGTPAEWVER